MKQIKYYKKVLEAVASKSSCNRAMVGAIIVKDKSIISTGFNGAPRGLSHCHKVNHYLKDGHCRNVLHAEVNAKDEKNTVH
jgi:dCMP deaminase